MRKTKILQLITGLSIGGAEKVVLDLSTHLDPHQFEVLVMVIGPEKAMLPQFDLAGIRVITLDMQKQPGSIIRACTQMQQTIRTQQIDLIHAHLFHAVFLASVLKILGRWSIPIVFTPHSANLESRLREALLRYLRPFRQCDVLFSSDLNKSFRKANFRLIPNGISSQQYQLSLERLSPFTFLAIGRLSPEKNFQALVEAARQIPTSYTFQILLAGTGPEQENLESLIQKYELAHRVKLLGLRADIPQLCNQAHAFLLPSLWEGWPMVLLEAGAAGLPIISTKVGAIPALLEENCAYWSQASDFAASMCRVMDNYSEAAEKGKRLQAKIQAHYDLSIIVKKHQVLYQDLLAGNLK